MRVDAFPAEVAAWILGGSGAIGSAIALELAKSGVNVAIGYYDNKEAGMEVARAANQLGVKAVASHVDVSCRQSIVDSHKQITKLLRAPLIMVYAAGDVRQGLIQDMTDKEYEYLFDVHMRGAFYIIQSLLSDMLSEKWGRIIFISSIWGETGAAMETLYSAAKSAQLGFMKGLAKELAPSGITVNAVTPGAIATPLLEKQISSEEQVMLAEEIPMGDIGSPADVAGAVNYICSASYMTGQTISINGGWYI